MIRVVAGILVMLALAGLWWHGYSKGIRTDKQRSDLVIAGMVNEAQSRLASANALVKQQSDAIQANKERAERDLQTERARNARRLADQRATDDLVRQQLANFASGVGSGENTASACISRAERLGQVLGGVLSDLGSCAAGAEHEAGNTRTLLEAWPVTK